MKFARHTLGNGVILPIASLATSAPATALYFTIIFALLETSGSLFLNIGIAALFLFAIPAGVILFFLRQGLCDFDVMNRKMRQNIYWLAIASFIIATAVFSLLGSFVMMKISFAYAAVTGALALINLRWKISAHTAGITGPLTALTFVLGPQVLPFHLLVIPVMFLRVKMRAHTGAQVVAGSLVAMIVTALVYVLI